jgi:hypothetical protein
VPSDAFGSVDDDGDDFEGVDVVDDDDVVVVDDFVIGGDLFESLVDAVVESFEVVSLLLSVLFLSFAALDIHRPVCTIFPLFFCCEKRFFFFFFFFFHLQRGKGRHVRSQNTTILQNTLPVDQIQCAVAIAPMPLPSSSLSAFFSFSFSDFQSNRALTTSTSSASATS